MSGRVFSTFCIYSHTTLPFYHSPPISSLPIAAEATSTTKPFQAPASVHHHHHTLSKRYHARIHARTFTIRAILSQAIPQYHLLLDPSSSACSKCRYSSSYPCRACTTHLKEPVLHPTERLPGPDLHLVHQSPPTWGTVAIDESITYLATTTGQQTPLLRYPFATLILERHKRLNTKSALHHHRTPAQTCRAGFLQLARMRGYVTSLPKLLQNLLY